MPVDSYQNNYKEKKLSNMITKRGCMAAVYHEGFLYCFGGINYVDKVMKKCERLDLMQEEQQWQKIADIRECRKNASACSVTADTIYIFGGSSNSVQALETIEQYSVAANRWNTISVAMPIGLCFLTTFKLTPTKILILGESRKEQPNS